MATNEILPFATTNTGTNLLTQAEYVADAERITGHQPGIARSKLENKALRQSSLIAAGVAQFIAQYQSNNVTDSLTVQQVADYLLAAVRFQIPSGIITMWSGSTANIPAGWFLCNGQNGTPDLRDRFVLGAGNSFAVGATGGSRDATLVQHTHTFSAGTSENGTHSHTVNDPTHAHGVYDPGHTHANVLPASPMFGGYGIYHEADINDASPTDGNTAFALTGVQIYGAYTGISINGVGNHNHNVTGTTSQSGSSATNANMPPYYALAYIMKG